MGDEGAILTPPGGDVEEATEKLEAAAAGEKPQEVPSVFSVINRYLIGAADVSDPAEDGSRVLRLYSANGQAVVEAALAPQLCEFLSGKLVEVKIIEQDDEENEGDGADQ